MPTRATERAFAELIPRAKGASKLDLRFSDVLAVAGRSDGSDPKIYHLSTHKFAMARSSPFSILMVPSTSPLRSAPPKLTCIQHAVTLQIDSFVCTLSGPNLC